MLYNIAGLLHIHTPLAEKRCTVRAFFLSISIMEWEYNEFNLSIKVICQNRGFDVAFKSI